MNTPEHKDDYETASSSLPLLNNIGEPKEHHIRIHLLATGGVSLCQ